MKSKFIYLQFVIIALLFSCSSNDDNSKEEDTSEFLTAKINGENFVVDNFYAKLIEYSTSNQIEIKAMNAGGNYIFINLADYEGVATYHLGSNYNISGTYYDSSEDQHYYCSIGSSQPVGSCTIESDNGQQIKGTFSFIGEILPNPENKPSVNVSNGSFVINY